MNFYSKRHIKADCLARSYLQGNTVRLKDLNTERTASLEVMPIWTGFGIAVPPYPRGLGSKKPSARLKL